VENQKVIKPHKIREKQKSPPTDWRTFHLGKLFEKLSDEIYQNPPEEESFERLPQMPVRASGAWATSPAHLHRMVCRYV
jgi:hypothetical protein